MKKLLIFFTSALLISSCNNAEKTDTTEPQGTVADSKDQEMELERSKKETLDSVNLANIRQRTIDSMNAVAASKVIEPKTTPRHTVRHTTPASNPSSPGTPASSNPQTQTAPTNESPSVATASPIATPTPASATKKKGLNNAVKGALIGLGTGAAAGAIIDKDHRGKGAIIGGVIGATGGAVGGAVLDKNKKKKAKQDSIDAANGVPK